MILKAGIRAATAGNLQLYALVVFDEDEQKEALGLTHAPLVIVAMVDLYRLKRWFELSDTAPVYNNRSNSLFIGFWDAIIALHNIVVTAESVGLGTCYMVSNSFETNCPQLTDFLRKSWGWRFGTGPRRSTQVHKSVDLR